MKVRQSSSGVARRNPARGQSAVPEHPSIHLQRRPGNPAGLWLTAEEDFSSTRERADDKHARGPAWDFSRIPIFPPVGSAMLRALQASAAPPTIIQRKLAVGEVNDPLEHEADHVAQQVIRMPQPRLQRKCACGGTCAECGKEGSEHQGAKLQMKPASAGSLTQHQAPASVHQVLRSPGQSLDPATRTFMEPRFGHDFSHVRIHTDGAASQSARDVNAHAYTVGHHLVFGSGRLVPQTHEGKRLIAHELSHVVQQESAGAIQKLQRAPGDGSDDPAITGTGDDAVEMWKDVIAQRHFQQTEGNVTFARLKIVDARGRVVVNLLTQSDTTDHGEEKAVRLARQQVGPGRKISDGKIIFVTDQKACDNPGRCRSQIYRLAQDLDVGEATVTTFSRPTVGEEEKGTVTGTGLPQQQENNLASPKATAKKVQKRIVEGLELTAVTEPIYTRQKPTASGGGGKTLAPVKPPAQTASGEITPGAKPTGKTASGGGGKTLAPAQPPAQTASGEITAKTPSAGGGGGTPPHPAETRETTAEIGARVEPVNEGTPGFHSEGAGIGGAVAILQAMQFANLQQDEVDKFQKRLAELQPKIDAFLQSGYSVQLLLIVEKPNSPDVFCAAGVACDQSQFIYFHDLYINYVENYAEPIKPVTSPSSNVSSTPSMGPAGGRDGYVPYTHQGGSIIDEKEIPYLHARDENHHCEYAKQTLYPQKNLIPVAPRRAPAQPAKPKPKLDPEARKALASAPSKVYLLDADIQQYKTAVEVEKKLTGNQLFGEVKEMMGGPSRSRTIVVYFADLDKPRAEALAEIVRSVGVPTATTELSGNGDGDPGSLEIFFGRDAEK
jgi:hypothetical protein